MSGKSDPEARVRKTRRKTPVGPLGYTVVPIHANERQLVQDILWFTHLVLKLSRYKFIADRMIRRLSHDEALFHKLLGIVAGSRRYADLSLLEKASLMMG